MKLWLSVVVAVFLSGQTLFSAEVADLNHTPKADEVKAAPVQAETPVKTPVQEQDTQAQDRLVKLVKYVNACLLDQPKAAPEAAGPIDSIARAMGHGPAF